MKLKWLIFSIALILFSSSCEAPNREEDNSLITQSWEFFHNPSTTAHDRAMLFSPVYQNNYVRRIRDAIYMRPEEILKLEINEIMKILTLRKKLRSRSDINKLLTIDFVNAYTSINEGMITANDADVPIKISYTNDSTAYVQYSIFFGGRKSALLNKIDGQWFINFEKSLKTHSKQTIGKLERGVKQAGSKQQFLRTLGLEVQLAPLRMQYSG